MFSLNAILIVGIASLLYLPNHINGVGSVNNGIEVIDLSALQDVNLPLVANGGSPCFEHHPIFWKFPSYFFPFFSEEYFEWIDLLESIDQANGQFVMLEVGAGLGRWAAYGGRVAKSRDISFWLGLVEGEPFRAEVGIDEEMRKNNISKSNYHIFKTGVGSVNKQTFFYVSRDEQTLENWYGQCILLDHDRVTQLLGRTYYGRPLVQTQYGYTAVQIEQQKFSEILNAINFSIIDLCDFDVQGSEFEVIQESINILNSRVKRLHIGTHSHEIEHSLRDLLKNNNWQLIRDYPFAQENETPYGKISFVDGVQTWVNKRFMNKFD